jgi:hypothetical protein
VGELKRDNTAILPGTLADSATYNSSHSNPNSQFPQNQAPALRALHIYMLGGPAQVCFPGLFQIQNKPAEITAMLGHLWYTRQRATSALG